MTLTHGRFISYEYDRMVVLFSMLDGNKEIPCAVSTSAMDDMEGVVRAKASPREAQFMRLRERIEACVNGKYQATEFEGTPPGIVLRGIDFRKLR
jgi:hypothetical protein